MYSKEHLLFIKKIKKRNLLVRITQISILIFFLLTWEFLSYYELINTFGYSSPSKVFNTIINLFTSNNLFNHIGITLYETILSFLISSLLGLSIATLLWSNKFISDVIDPYLTVLNSLPKVALGPLIIIWVGASINSIILMALLISTFISIINIYNGFISTNKNHILLMKSLHATKRQIFLKLVIPSNINNLINTFKINISMNLIGVIMGELLVSKSGLGYLIMYGSQVFNINLTITSTLVLGLISYIMYYLLNKIDLYLKKKQS